MRIKEVRGLAYDFAFSVLRRNATGVVLLLGGGTNQILTVSALMAQLQPIADGVQAGKFRSAREVMHAIDHATDKANDKSS